MGETEISWTHRPGTVGRSWNPVQGCRMVSPGCANCYAQRMAARFSVDGWSQGLINLTTKKWNGEARLATHKLSEPLRWRKPATVFVNSMSDLFYEGFTNEQIAAVFGAMAACPQHTFQILTKRAKRMREWFEWLRVEADRSRDSAIVHYEDTRDMEVRLCIAWLDTHHVPRKHVAYPVWPLPNVWIGTSVENQAAAHERIPELLATPAAVRFLSCEPLIDRVDLDRDGLLWKLCTMCHGSMSVRVDGGGVACPRCFDHQGVENAGIGWVIAGCESGPGARPCSVAWLRRLRNDCATYGVPFFLKQAVESDMGKCRDADNPNGDDPCGKPVRYFVHGPKDSSISCGCTGEGAEDANGCPALGAGEGSKRKGGGVIELPYLDGSQHAAFPETR